MRPTASERRCYSHSTFARRALTSGRGRREPACRAGHILLLWACLILRPILEPPIFWRPTAPKARNTVEGVHPHPSPNLSHLEVPAIGGQGLTEDQRNRIVASMKEAVARRLSRVQAEPLAKHDPFGEFADSAGEEPDIESHVPTPEDERPPHDIGG